jgi:uncharacterized protein (TIGR02186 family)
MLLALLLPFAAAARPIIADLSEDKIYINESFTGKDILLFGARNAPGDIIVVLRGPRSDYTLRRKERVFGVWVNHDQTKFRDVPVYYKIYSTRPLEEIAPEKIRADLRLGFDHIGLVPNRPLDEPSARGFTEAFMERQQRRGLFLVDDRRAVSYKGESLFKVPVSFPDSIPEGEYTAEVYLFMDGQLASVQTIPLSVTRTGFDAVVSRASQQNEVLYGMMAVLSAVALGWLGNHLFKKV